MEAEKMEYEMEQRTQLVDSDVRGGNGGGGDVMQEDYHNYPITESPQYRRETLPTIDTFLTTITPIYGKFISRISRTL